MIEAIIPCRGGSTRVVKKNIRPFAGSSLLEIKIRQALRVGCFDRVTVNSDDDEMLDLARSLGANAVRREAGMGDSSVSGSDLARALARQATGNVVAVVKCTAPLLRDNTLAACVQYYCDRGSHGCDAAQPHYDSVNTAALVKEFLWLDGRPINYDPALMPKSQNLPPVVRLTFACDVIARDLVAQHGGSIAPAWRPVIVGDAEAVDIDTPAEWDYAEWLYQQRGGENGLAA